MSWTLYIHTVKGKTNALCVESSHSILSVKESIQELTGLKVRLQKLLFNGRHLEDDEATLLSYGVQNWSKIILVPQAEPEEDEGIVIKTLSGKSIFVRAKLNDTVADICTKIQKKEGMASEQQQLIYGGKVLEWDVPLDRYNIQRGSSLHVVCAAAQRKVLLRFPAGSGAKADVVPLAVLLSDSVEKVLKRIAEKFQFPHDRHELFFKGVRLEKSQSLGQYHISSDSIIDVRVKGNVASDVPSQEQVEDGAVSQDAAIPQDLFVRTPMGRMVSVEFLPTDTIKSIKKKVHAKVGLEPESQVMLLEGTPLEDDATLTSYNISTASTLHVVLHAKNDGPQPESDGEPRPGTPDDLVQIFIKTVTGMTFGLEVNLSGTVSDVKARIQRLKGIPCNQQELLIRGEPLKDALKLRDYNIETESTFYLTLTPRQAEESLHLFIRTARSTLELRASPESMVKGVKEDIFAIARIPVEHQRLFVDSVELKDDVSLSSHGIQNNHSLSLEVMDPATPEVVYVRNMMGKTVSIDIFPTDKVKSLKERVFDKEGIPVEQQRLVFQGKDLDDNQFIKHYNIEQESNLQLALAAPVRPSRISISLPTATPGEWKKVAIDIPLTSKVQDLKRKVHKVTGIIPNELILFAGSQELCDNDATLNFYKVAALDFLQVKIKRRERVIFVKNLKHTITLNVSLDDRVIDVKTKVENKEGIHPSRQRLLFQGTELHDDAVLADCKIDQRSTLILSLKEVAGSHKVRVTMPSGTVLPVDVCPSDTMASVKRAVQRYMHIPFSRQNLVDGSGTVLPDESKATAAGEVMSMQLGPVAVSVVVTKYDHRSKARVISVNSVATVDGLKQQVEAVLNVPRNRLKFFLDGVKLSNELSHLLEEGSMILLGKCLWCVKHLILDLSWPFNFIKVVVSELANQIDLGYSLISQAS